MTNPRRIGAGAGVKHPGNASVVPVGRRWQGHCTCGHFAPKLRLLKGFAVTDTQQHAGASGCALERPLVVSRSLN